MIIAEIGLNHLGQYVEEYVEELISTDVDAITLQVREKEYYDRKPHLLLTAYTYPNFIETVHRAGKKVGIAIGDSCVDFFEGLGVDFYKVIRNDITNLPLIDSLKATNKEIIVSTELSSEDEINQFVKYINWNRNFKLNHTQLSYEVKDCNLSAIHHMKDRYNLDVSFGLHSDNINVLYMALVYEPSDILFYVKLDRDLEYPDSRHAIPLKKVNEVVKNLKALPLALGDGRKRKMENKMR